MSTNIAIFSAQEKRRMKYLVNQMHGFVDEMRTTLCDINDFKRLLITRGLIPNDSKESSVR